MSNDQNLDLTQLLNQVKQAETVVPQQPLPDTAIPGVVTTPHQAVQAPVQEQQPVVPAHQRPILPPTDDAPQTGLILDNKAITKEVKSSHAYANEINPESLANIGEYVSEMEDDYKDAEEVRKQFENVNNWIAPVAEAAEEKKESSEEEEDEVEVNPEVASQELNEKFEQAIVVIDKLNSGKLEFTEEEREKLERVSKIKLEEVETIDIKQFKTKKSKKNNLEKILKRQPKVHTTPIVLPASGFTATMAGASTYELISLMGGSEDPVRDTTSKWTVIFNKLADTSLGKLNFNDFLRATAAIDYNVFIYGLLCSTYPNDDVLPLQCVNDKCLKTFEHKYQVRSLLRAEQMTDDLKAKISTTIDGAHTKEDAQRVHDEAAVNQVKVVKLPDSEYVMEVYVQSAHDLINNSIKSLAENQEEQYNQASILSTIVKTAYIPDPDEPGSYFEYDNAMDITKIIYELKDTDILVLSKQSELVLNDQSFEFGLMNVKCPHCGHYRETVPFDIESILFYRYQQAMNTSVE